MITEPTNIEFDFKRITLLLGDTPETHHFISRIKIFIYFQLNARISQLDYPKTASTQFDILMSIVDKCGALLDVLKPIGLKENLPPKCVDIETGNLLRHHLFLINRKNRIERDLQSNDEQNHDLSSVLSISLEKMKAELFLEENNDTVKKITQDKQGNATALDYPNQVYYSVLELKEIATHAANEVKPKKGNSSKRNPESIRKEKLANLFVSTYLDCFKKLPPMTAHSNAHKVFVYCLDFAEFPEEENSHHCLKKAILKFRPEAQVKKKSIT